jgi:hypothetical protein
MMRTGRALAAAGFLAVFAGTLPALGQDMLGKLAEKLDFRSRRISSYDRTGGNTDFLRIEPGATVVIADIKGPAAIHHVWMTVAAEAFYGRKIVLRAYWDGEDAASVEAPLGDFFGVGHGLDRDLSSLPVACSSAGRARNAYWYMPFRWSCRLTVTNDGPRPVDAFYFAIDYRELSGLDPAAPYFHAQYRQEMPCLPGKDYILLDAVGRGHYVGCNLSVLQRSPGWWGEGDDKITVDGDPEPTLHGTGTEDYFSEAWGLRPGGNLFYGCPLQEEDFQVGSKATAYRFHIPDPVPFSKSIRVAFEHGHANDRADFYSSVAYWYQAEPHDPFPELPAVDKRLPFALESLENFLLPRWRSVPAQGRSVYEDAEAGLRIAAPRLAAALTSYYDQRGTRFPVVTTEGAVEGTRAELDLSVRAAELYDIDLYLVRGPVFGNVRILLPTGPQGPASALKEAGTFSGYAEQRQMGVVSLKAVLLREGENRIVLEVSGRDPRSAGTNLSFMGVAPAAAARHFVADWDVVGPFDAPDMDALAVAYPPEQQPVLSKRYTGKNGLDVTWTTVRAEASGYVRLDRLLQPAEKAVAYALAYVRSPSDRTARMLVGSDDGVRIWVNGELIHSNPIYRGAAPDQDNVPVRLRKGWNKVLVKVLQGGGGWGFYLRFADPMNELAFGLGPADKKE